MRNLLNLPLCYQADGGAAGGAAGAAGAGGGTAAGDGGSAGDGAGAGKSGDGGTGAGDGAGKSATVERAELERVIAQRDEAKARGGTLDAQIVELQAKVTAHEKTQSDATTKSLTDAGKYQEALEGKQTEFAAQLASSKAEVLKAHQSSARQMLRAIVATTENVAPTAIDDVTALLNSRLSLDADSEYKVKVLTVEGLPAVGDDGKALTIEAMVTAYLADKPHYRLAAGAVGPKGAGAPGGGGVGGDLDRALRDPEYQKAWKASDPKGFAAAVEARALNQLTPSGLAEHRKKSAGGG